MDYGHMFWNIIVTQRKFNYKPCFSHSFCAQTSKRKESKCIDNNIFLNFTGLIR